MKEKYLSLTLQFTDVIQLEEAMYKVLKDLKNGIRSNRQFVDETAILQWNVDYVHEVAYREDFINGKVCHVFQSSLNDDENE